jgi:4-amino-4-deoxy-L-arabinose transferase-like glycosyltransferase
MFIHTTRAGWGIVVALLLSVLFGLVIQQNLSSRPLFAVAYKNLLYADGLSSAGTFGQRTGQAEPVKPIVGRDMFTPLVLAGWMKLTIADLRSMTPQQLNTGDTLIAIKNLNALLLGLSAFLLYLCAVGLFRSAFIAVIAEAIFIVLISLRLNRDYVDSATVEPLAILITAAFTLAVINLFNTRSVPWLLAASLSLALLTLSKAIFLYLVAPVALIVGILAFCRGLGPRLAILCTVLLIAVPAVLAGSWMWRNSQISGEFKLAAGGGIVLYYRALLDTMDREEYRGSFYTLAPPSVRPFVGRVLGYSEADLKPGGRLQRLGFFDPDVRRHDQDTIARARPDQTISFRHRITAENRARAQQPDDEESSSDRGMQNDALRIIRDHPWAHLALVIPIVWHGMWIDAVPALAAPFLFWSVVLAAVLALVRRDYRMLAICILPLGSAAAYGFLSHFIPRYSVPMLPVMVLCLTYLAAAPFGAMRKSSERRSDAAVPA